MEERNSEPVDDVDVVDEETLVEDDGNELEDSVDSDLEDADVVLLEDVDVELDDVDVGPLEVEDVVLLTDVDVELRPAEVVVAEVVDGVDVTLAEDEVELVRPSLELSLDEPSG